MKSLNEKILESLKRQFKLRGLNKGTEYIFNVSNDKYKSFFNKLCDDLKAGRAKQSDIDKFCKAFEDIVDDNCTISIELFDPDPNIPDHLYVYTLDKTIDRDRHDNYMWTQQMRMYNGSMFRDLSVSTKEIFFEILGNNTRFYRVEVAVN